MFSDKPTQGDFIRGTTSGVVVEENGLGIACSTKDRSGMVRSFRNLPAATNMQVRVKLSGLAITCMLSKISRPQDLHCWPFLAVRISDWISGKVLNFFCSSEFARHTRIN